VFMPQLYRCLRQGLAPDLTDGLSKSTAVDTQKIT
jgi:hypothetical protein